MSSILASDSIQHFRMNPTLRKAHDNPHMQFALFSCAWTAGSTDGPLGSCSWFLPSLCCTPFLCNRFHATLNQFMSPWSSFTISCAHLIPHFSTLSAILSKSALNFSVMRFFIFQVLQPWLEKWAPSIWGSPNTLQRPYRFGLCIWPGSLRTLLRLVWLRLFRLSAGLFVHNHYTHQGYDKMKNTRRGFCISWHRTC